MSLKEAISKLKEKTMGIYNRKIGVGRTTIFLISNKIYHNELLNITKSAADKYAKIAYISLNKPAQRVVEIFIENNIDTKKFLFIDAVTEKNEANSSNQGIVHINPPKNFEKFNAELNEIIGNLDNLKFLIFDSLSTLLIYQDEITVIKFAHNLMTNLAVTNVSGHFICLLDDVSRHLVKTITLFADEVRYISEEGELSEEGEIIEVGEKKIGLKGEKIQKLEKELKAIKEAHASGFVSEESFLRTKERIDGNLKRLRK